MLFDAGLAAVSFAVLWLFGLPVIRILIRTETDINDIRRWHAAPFVGCGIIILLSQTLFYLHIPVGQSAIFLWAAAALAWLCLVYLRQLPNWQSFEWSLLAVLIGIFVVQGLGFFMLGSDVYVGRGWHDQYNYVSTAELIANYPYGTGPSEIAGHPYLLAGVEKQTDRIGQSVLQAFYMKSFGLSGKSAFGFVALLGPVMIAVAISWLCRELGLKRATALLAATIAGTMPAITLTHLECFLSQTLGTPFLLAWPIMLSVASHPNTGDNREKYAWLFFGGVTAAAGWSVYTEYLPLFLGVCLIFVLAEIARRSLQTPAERISPLTWIIVAPLTTLVLGLALDPLYMSNIGPLLMSRAGAGSALDGLYPWSGRIEGITHLWLGSLQAPSGPLRTVLDATAILLFACGVGGQAAYAVGKKSALAAAGFALLAAPWAVAIMLGSKFGYQHYKILASVSPLLPVGLACMTQTAQSGRPLLRRYSGAISAATLIVALGFSVAGTVDLTFRAGGGAGLTLEAIGRGGAFKLIDPAMRDIQRQLEARNGQTIYLAWFDNFFGGNFVNGWLVYFSRHNTVYVVNPVVGDGSIATGHGFDAAIRDPASGFVLIASTRLPVFDQYLQSGDSPFLVYELPREAWPQVRQQLAIQMPDPKRWP